MVLQYSENQTKCLASLLPKCPALEVLKLIRGRAVQFTPPRPRLVSALEYKNTINGFQKLHLISTYLRPYTKR